MDRPGGLSYIRLTDSRVLAMRRNLLMAPSVRPRRAASSLSGRMRVDAPVHVAEQIVETVGQLDDVAAWTLPARGEAIDFGAEVADAQADARSVFRDEWNHLPVELDGLVVDR